jgi:hypothetical protein
MGIIGQRSGTLAVALVLCLGLSRSGTAQTAETDAALSIEATDLTVYRAKEPARVPIAKSEVRGRAPSNNAVWVPGYWDLRGDRNTGRSAGWVWEPGRWRTPRVQQARWDPAHWGFDDAWWSWVPGHWVAQGPHGYPPSLTSDKISHEVDSDDLTQDVHPPAQTR